MRNERPVSSVTGNCVTDLTQNKKLSAIDALKKCKDFEKRHIYEKVIIDQKTTAYKLIGKKDESDRPKRKR